MTLYEVDAVIDRTGLIGRRLEVGESTVTLADESGRADAGIVRMPGFIVPGLRDAHIHLASISAATTGVTLAGARDLDEVSELLGRHGAGDIVAIGFDETEMAGAELLTAAELDSVVGDRAVLVYRVCGHIAMASSAALDRAGVGAATPDPPGGSIDRDRSGRPTGVLRETAIDLVSTTMEDTERGVGDDQLSATITRLLELGLTSVTAMVPAGAPAWCGPDDELDRLLDLGGGHDLGIDAVLISDRVEDLRFHAGRLDGEALRFGGWKGFADGSLGGHTAALTAPYADQPGNSGTLRQDSDRFRDLAEAAIELDGSVCIHAIGDEAVSSVLDLFSDLVRLGASPERLRVEHASILSPSLIDRMADLGIVASVQPAFVASDARWLERRLGPTRARWAYPFRSMLEAGVRLVGGSDAPVEEPDPLAGARVAVSRAGWSVEESLGPDEALALYADGEFTDRAVWVSSDLDRFERLA